MKRALTVVLAASLLAVAAFVGITAVESNPQVVPDSVMEAVGAGVDGVVEAAGSGPYNCDYHAVRWNMYYSDCHNVTSWTWHHRVVVLAVKTVNGVQQWKYFYGPWSLFQNTSVVTVTDGWLPFQVTVQRY